MIRKLASGKYRLYSRKVNPKTGKRRNLGTFASRAAAQKHERAVQYFKRGGWRSINPQHSEVHRQMLGGNLNLRLALSPSKVVIDKYTIFEGGSCEPQGGADRVGY